MRSLDKSLARLREARRMENLVARVRAAMREDKRLFSTMLLRWVNIRKVYKKTATVEWNQFGVGPGLVYRGHRIEWLAPCDCRGKFEISGEYMHAKDCVLMGGRHGA